MGKGLISFDIAARLTRGLPMPGGPSQNPNSKIQNSEPANVLFCTSEDSLGVAQKTRAIAAGADLSRIFSFPASQFQSSMKSRAAIQYVLEKLELAICQGEYALVIIDPLFGFFEALGAACERDARQALTALTKMAERLGCAILAIIHLNKSAGRSAIYRGSGAIAFTAVARFVFCLGSSPFCHSDRRGAGGEGVRALACIKNNVSAHPPSLSFDILPADNGAARIEWLAPVDLTADDLLARPSARKPPAETVARDWLAGLLANGPLAEDRVRNAAKHAGISINALTNAKASLGAKSTRTGFAKSAHWLWELPATGQAG